MATALAVEEIEAVTVPQARKVQQNLSVVNIVCKGWTARTQDKNAKVIVDGQEVETHADEKKGTRQTHTQPCKKFDFHPIFSEIHANSAKIERLKKQMCFNIGMKGVYVISNSKIGEFWAAIARLKDERDEIIGRMIQEWPDAVRLMQAAHTDFDKFSKCVPSANMLRTAYQLIWDPPMTITPVLTDDIDVSTLNDEDRWRVINESNAKIREKTNTIVDQAMRQVFGEMLKLCTSINSGSIETGKRKSGAIDEMLNVLTRIKNFSVFATSEILQQVDTATAALNSISINDLNGDPDVQRAIKTAFNPLAESVTKLMEANKPGSSKAYRNLAV